MSEIINNGNPKSNNVLYREPHPFTQVSNHAINDIRLTLKARGLYSILVSKATLEGWKFNKDWLISQSNKDGKTSFETAFKELKFFGYLEIKRCVEAGRFYYEWKVFEKNRIRKNRTRKTGMYSNTYKENNTETNNTKREQKGATKKKLPDYPLIKYNYNLKKLTYITEKQKTEWREKYPDIDIEKELQSISDWCLINRSKVSQRKKGLFPTISTWLRRTQGDYQNQINCHKSKQVANESQYERELRAYRERQELREKDSTEELER